MLVVGAAIVRDGRCLVAKRSPTMRAPGKWEFPGGKVEVGETPHDALVREISEELGVTIEVGALLGRGTATPIVLDVYLAALVAGEPQATEHAELRWIGPDEVEALDWAEADQPVLSGLVDALRARACTV